MDSDIFGPMNELPETVSEPNIAQIDGRTTMRKKGKDKTSNSNETSLLEEEEKVKGKEEKEEKGGRFRTLLKRKSATSTPNLGTTAHPKIPENMAQSKSVDREDSEGSDFSLTSFLTAGLVTKPAPQTSQRKNELILSDSDVSLNTFLSGLNSAARQDSGSTGELSLSGFLSGKEKPKHQAMKIPSKLSLVTNKSQPSYTVPGTINRRVSAESVFSTGRSETSPIDQCAEMSFEHLNYDRSSATSCDTPEQIEAAPRVDMATVKPAPAVTLRTTGILGKLYTIKGPVTTVNFLQHLESVEGFFGVGANDEVEQRWVAFTDYKIKTYGALKPTDGEKPLREVSFEDCMALPEANQSADFSFNVLYPNGRFQLRAGSEIDMVMCVSLVNTGCSNIALAQSLNGIHKPVTAGAESIVERYHSEVTDLTMSFMVSRYLMNEEWNYHLLMSQTVTFPADQPSLSSIPSTKLPPSTISSIAALKDSVHMPISISGTFALASSTDAITLSSASELPKGKISSFDEQPEPTNINTLSLPIDIHASQSSNASSAHSETSTSAPMSPISAVETKPIAVFSNNVDRSLFKVNSRDELNGCDTIKYEKPEGRLIL